MITLIHGEDTAVSRNFYFDLKKKTPESITLDGLSIALTDLQQAVDGQDLFGNVQSVFIEDLLSKRKANKDVQLFVDVINKSGADITLWESKELTPKQSGLLSKATVRLFKIPSTIFAFLDGVKPGNGKQLIELFHKTLEDKDPEFVLFMLTRLIRTLLSLSSRHPELVSGSQSISEVSRLAPWQRGKIEKQAKLFTVEELVELHGKLFVLELGMKTGGLTLPIQDEIDSLLLKL